METVKNILLNSSGGQYLALFCGIWPALFIPINFGLYYSYDSDNYYREDGVHQLPTISLAGSRLPSSALLTYGLHFEGFALLFFFIAVHKEMQRRIPSFHILEPTAHGIETPLLERIVEVTTFNGCGCCCCCSKEVNAHTLTRWNNLSAFCGVFAAFCMTIVGSIQLVANEAAHGTFAFFMFLFGVCHVLVFYYGLSKSLSNHPIAQLLRQLCIFISVQLNIVVIIIAIIVRGACGEFSCRSFAVNVAPILEFTTVVGLLLYMASFYWDLAATTLVHVEDPASAPKLSVV